jgi:hypothetical protein
MVFISSPFRMFALVYALNSITAWDQTSVLRGCQASLQPVPAAATSSARAGLRSQSQKILLNEVNPFQSRRSLPAAAAATLTPSKRKDEHPQSPDGKRYAALSARVSRNQGW